MSEIITYNTIIQSKDSGENIQAKTDGQQLYVDNINNNLITFGVGPAGSGKTFLAIACACKALVNKDVHKIVMSRPVVEAGESLGFLPGTLKEKIDPYLQPLYDSLYDILGKDTVLKYISSGKIEIAPLAYMRGRTLSDAFIILDEAQNATKNQLKMFLTRFGLYSKMVVTLDPTQIDLVNKGQSCIKDVQLFNGISEISHTELDERDIVRHYIINKILRAYNNE